MRFSMPGPTAIAQGGAPRQSILARLPKLRFRIVACVSLASIAVTAITTAQQPKTDLPGARDSAAGHRVVDEMSFRATIAEYCLHCHTGPDAEAGVRLDDWPIDWSRQADRELAESVFSVLRDERMPPEDETPIDAKLKADMQSFLSHRLEQLAKADRRAAGAPRHRRMTNDEYDFTLQQIFGVDAGMATALPTDPLSEDGYVAHRGRLELTAIQMECYLESARTAVARYAPTGPTGLEPLRYFVEYEDQYYSAEDRYGTRKRAPHPMSSDAFAKARKSNRRQPPELTGPLTPIPPGRFPDDEKLRAAIPKLHQRFIALPLVHFDGELIVRVRAGGKPDRHGRYPRMRVESGITLGDGCSMDTRVLGEIDVTSPPNAPRVYEFRMRLEDNPTKGNLRDEESFDPLSVFDMNQIFVSNVTRDQLAIYALGPTALKPPNPNADAVQRPLDAMLESGVNSLYLDSLEVEMLPGRSAGGPYRWQIDREVAGETPDQQRRYVAGFLKRFMREAYRRSPTSKQRMRRMALFDSLIEEGAAWDDALRETMVAVLVSAPFLILEHPATASNDDAGPSHSLASRLSYLLWQGPPDERLRSLASQRQLERRDVYTAEAARLLDDPLADRFIDDFCQQWLRLDKFHNVAVDAEHHPQYDIDLARASLEETRETLRRVFRDGASALRLIHSPFVYVNDRLSGHYDLPISSSGDFQQVRLPEDSPRGGLLTQASLLTMNSDGHQSHPIRRGVWILDRLLNDPPPPPPPNVPELDEVESKAGGHALTLKQRIALHRQPGSCRACHQKIDPWGIALEDFGATGSRREGGKPDDARATLRGGQVIDGVSDLKSHLTGIRSESFTRGLTHHMLTYALERSLDFGDRELVDDIHRQFAAGGFRLRALVMAIVGSKEFRGGLPDP